MADSCRATRCTCTPLSLISNIPVPHGHSPVDYARRDTFRVTPCSGLIPMDINLDGKPLNTRGQLIRNGIRPELTADNFALANFIWSVSAARFAHSRPYPL